MQPDGLKYILALRAGERDCLFDLARDPLERENLLAARPDDARRLRAALEALVAEARARSVEPGPPADGSAAHLQALGYAGGQEEEEPKPRRTPQVIQMPKR